VAPKSRPRLLVIDDDPGITSTFQALLSSEGYDVATAADGVEALALVRRESFDLILLDLQLPGMDGWTILQHLRRLAPTARVVILCADVDSAGEIEAFRLGAVDVLLKPPDVHKLLRFVDELTRPAEDKGTFQETAGCARLPSPRAAFPRFLRLVLLSRCPVSSRRCSRGASPTRRSLPIRMPPSPSWTASAPKSTSSAAHSRCLP